MCYRYAYFLENNGIVERCHRTVKKVAARILCSIPEAVYWYNVEVLIEGDHHLLAICVISWVGGVIEIITHVNDHVSGLSGNGIE